MSNSYFQFKQFKVCHERCAMKVGTDGVLLGAWARLTEASSVLDIGTGTGLIALMAAQRNAIAQVTAIDIEPDAVAQAMENVQMSPWCGRIEVLCADARTYEPSMKFDAIVSNPPYFKNSFKSRELKRLKARHTDNLTYEDLLSCATRLLAEDGELSVVIPFDAAFEFISVAAGKGLYLVRKTCVYTVATAAPKRVLLAFRKRMPDMGGAEESGELVIETGQHTYTDAYRQLTKDFYISF